jgi:pyruvate kinase
VTLRSGAPKAVQVTSPPSSRGGSAADAERAALERVAHDLSLLEKRIARVETRTRASIARVPEVRRESARNLVHYLALRQSDLRDLQEQLAQLGLSSLGRSESCVRASLLEVSKRVHEALGGPRDEAPGESHLTWAAAREALHENTRRILGPRPERRHVYVMVTAPSAKEADRAWMLRMLRANMNVLRVNCAHEGPEEWSRILDALADARRQTGKPCRVLMDLAGPKIRTGAIAGRRVVTWKVPKNEVGKVTAPARVAVGRLGSVSEAALLLDDSAFAAARPGDLLRFDDARGKKRALRVGRSRRSDAADALVCHAHRRAYVLDGTLVRVWRRDKPVAAGHFRVSGAGAFVDVRPGDELVLTGRSQEGRAPLRDARGRIVRRGVIACSLPAALDGLKTGHRVLFDDGRIEALVMRAYRKRRDFVLRVVRTQEDVVKLRAEKGINLPDTSLAIPALTREDLQALAFVVAHADVVGLSFVRGPEDLRALHRELDRLRRPDLGIVLKIETRAGFEALPRLLLEGLRRPALGVMIARGDLAVEVGFERLAELQDEILWLCEASQVPTIWATQVLDTLARTGVPSRAEVTDAAASVAAECVMLNKGPFVDRAVRTLDDILRRMERHRDKKRSLYRKLRVSRFVES